MNNLYKRIWNEIKKEYFQQHPAAGLAIWDIPLDQQPDEFKIEMYNIFWTITHKEVEK